MTNLLQRAGWSAYALASAWGDERRPYLPLERVLEIQARKARRIYRHACQTVPRYRDLMQADGLRPRDVRSAADFARLPFATGDELATSPQRYLSDRYASRETLELRSSGTGGRPKLVRYSSGALFTALAHGQRQRAVLARFVGRRFGYREMSAQRSASVSHQLRAFYESRSWVPRSVELRRAEISLDAGFEDAARRLADFRPEVLFGYGSYIGALFRWAHERGRAIHRPLAVWYGADRMADADRDLLETTFGVPVVSTYQADEALRIGFQCELRRGFHLFLDDLAVRVVDEHGCDVRPGETGEVVISNLTNRATVLLNYRLGDLATLAATPCPCGRSLPTIEGIEGRADDLLRLPNGEILHSLSFIHKLQAVSGIVRVQLEQVTTARLVVRAVCSADRGWEPARAQLAALLSELLPAVMEVTIERVAEMPRESGGKVRAVISRCRETP